jgi:hypothetical protein
VIERLSSWLEAGDIGEPLARHTRVVIDELAGLEGTARSVRGDARGRLIERLADIERQFAGVLGDAVEPAVRETLRAEAVRDLEPFRQRMPPPAYEQALVTGTERLICDHYKLPRIAFD